MPRKREAPPRTMIADKDKNTRVKLGKLLDQLGGLKGVPQAARDALAGSLVDAVHYAAAGVPRMAARVRTPTSTGKRRPGGGRPQDQTREVLGSDVEAALIAAGLPATRWQDEAGIGLLPEVLAACWQVATGEKMHNAHGRLKDWRRITRSERRWKRLGSSWRRCTRTGLWLPEP